MSQKSSLSVSVVLPVYNEEKIIEASLKKYIDSLSQDFEDYEIIVVDDGSKDNSLEIISKIASDNKHIKVLKNLINLNQGISMQRGFSIASKDIVMHNGADLPFDPTKTKEVIIQHWKNIDVLVLERTYYTGATRKRKVISECNKILRTLLFPKSFSGMKDLNFIQFYSNTVLKDVMPLASSPTFTSAEMIYRTMHLKHRIKNIPFEYQGRPVGKGSLGKVHDITWSIYDMLRFKYLVLIGLDKNGKLK